MVSELTMISSALDSDFDGLEISSENSIRKQLTSGLNKLDNGAKDNNPTANQACLGVWSFFSGALLDFQVRNPVFPYLETKAYIQTGIAGGMAWSFLDYQLDFGLGAKFL